MEEKEKSRLIDEIYRVIISKLEEEKLPYYAGVKIYEYVFTVGVQGDNRTYCPVVEITLFENGRMIYNEELAHYLGTEIPNKIHGTNRVIFTVPINLGH